MPCLLFSCGNSIQFKDHFYSPPLSKVHYVRALYSSRKIKNWLTSEIWYADVSSLDNSPRTVRPRDCSSHGLFVPRTVRPTNCSFHVRTKMLFNHLLEAGLKK